MIINKYIIESVTLLDTLWLLWRALGVQIPTSWQMCI